MKALHSILIYTILTLNAICVLSGVATAQTMMTLSLEVNRQTLYSIDKGENAGELTLTVEGYPEDLLSQLESQFNEHLVAIKVIDRTPARMQLTMIIFPVVFEFSHLRRVQPQQIQISLIFDNTSQSKMVSTIPPLPVWEMLEDGTIILPPAEYQKVAGPEGVAKEFRNALSFFELGAYSTARNKLQELLKSGNGELWQESLTLLGETMFNEAFYSGSSMYDARRALGIAEQESKQDIWRSRALLLLSWAHTFSGDLKNGAIYFERGAKTYPILKPYFVLGRLQVAVSRDEIDLARELVREVKQVKNLPEEAITKLCFSEVLLVLRSGDVAKANKLADSCMKQFDRAGVLDVGQLLAVAEARLLAYRYGEAKDMLNRVMRDFADHPKAALAAMRLGDALFFENRWTEAQGAYELCVQRWPGSSYARLAEIKGKELAKRQERVLNPMKVYTELDMHHEPEPVGRESKLRLMWYYDEDGVYDQAYIYLVEVVRRYNGMKYWPFQRDRLSRIVSKAYEYLAENEDHLNIIKLYQAKEDFPLNQRALDRVSVLVANAYAALGKFQLAVDAYLEALANKERTPEGERNLLVGLTQAYMAEGDLYRAEKTQEYFGNRFNKPEDERVHNLLMGEILEARGDMEESLKTYERVIEATTDPAERRRLSFKIGRVFYRQQRFEKATLALAPALEHFLDPNLIIDPDVIPETVRNAMFFLADSYYRVRMFRESSDVYLRIISLFPKDSRVPIAHYYAAEGLVMSDRKELAMKEYDTLKNMDDPFWQEVGSLKAAISEWFVKHDLLDY